MESNFFWVGVKVWWVPVGSMYGMGGGEYGMGVKICGWGSKCGYGGQIMMSRKIQCNFVLRLLKIVGRFHDLAGLGTSW